MRARWAENLSLADLRRALARGETPIVDIQAWPDRAPKSWRDDWDDGHYVVLVGMDGSFAYFMDPSTDGSYAYMPLAELADRWHDFEDRGGKVRRYVHFAAFIRGRSAPAPSKAPNGALQPLS